MSAQTSDVQGWKHRRGFPKAYKRSNIHTFIGTVERQTSNVKGQKPLLQGFRI
jgi:hypothetical protein